MTSKHPSASADSTGLSSLSCFAPQFSFESSLLASIIPLPENTLISYAVWSPVPSAKYPDLLSHIELARKKIIQQNHSLSVSDSLLPSLHISGGAVALYVFAIGSTDNAAASRVALGQLSFVGLTGACSMETYVSARLSSVACWRSVLTFFFRIRGVFFHPHWSLPMLGRLFNPVRAMCGMYVAHKPGTGGHFGAPPSTTLPTATLSTIFG